MQLERYFNTRNRLTTDVAAEAQASPGVASKLIVYGFFVKNGSMVSTEVEILEGAVVKMSIPCGTGGDGIVVDSTRPIIKLAAGTALNVKCGTTGAAVEVCVWGDIENV